MGRQGVWRHECQRYPPRADGILGGSPGRPQATPFHNSTEVTTWLSTFGLTGPVEKPGIVVTGEQRELFNWNRDAGAWSTGPRPDHGSHPAGVGPDKRPVRAAPEVNLLPVRRPAVERSELRAVRHCPDADRQARGVGPDRAGTTQPLQPHRRHVAQQPGGPGRTQLRRLQGGFPNRSRLQSDPTASRHRGMRR